MTPIYIEALGRHLLAHELDRILSRHEDKLLMCALADAVEPSLENTVLAVSHAQRISTLRELARTPRTTTEDRS